MKTKKETTTPNVIYIPNAANGKLITQKVLKGEMFYGPAFSSGLWFKKKKSSDLFIQNVP